MILLRVVCWIREVWRTTELCMPGVTVSGHEYEEVEPNVLKCWLCGHISRSK